jgi:phospholipid transport system substrate-binding protein
MWSRRTTVPAFRRVGVLAALIAALAGAAIASGRARATQNTDPAAAKVVVRQTVDQVLAVLARKDLSIEERRSLIEDIAFERFDFPTMSRLVLKRSWLRFSPAQREQFVKEFREYLAASYGTRIERYHQEKVDVTGDRVEPRGDVTVMTRIKGGSADGIEIDYRMRDRDGTWKVIDVVIEGVSLVQNFHSQFADILSKGGPEELLRRLKERNTGPPPPAAS